MTQLIDHVAGDALDGALDDLNPDMVTPVTRAPQPQHARRSRLQGAGRATRGGGAVAGLLTALAAAAAAAAYLTFPHAAVFSRVPRQATTWAVPVAALAAVIAAAAAWRAARRVLAKSKGADALTVVAATVASVVSATGMWAFFARYVPGIDVFVRVPIFAFLEVSTIAEGLRARDNMRDYGYSGLDGAAMWALTGTSAFLSSLASTTLAEALFRLAPPLAAAWLWERLLVSERRRRAVRRHDGITWRVSPQRILVHLRLADPGDQTIGEAAAQRRLTHLALAAEKAAALDRAGVASGYSYDRADRALRRAMRAAIRYTDLASSTPLQQLLVSQVLILRSPRDLVDLDAGSPWARLAAEGGGQGDRRQQDRERRDRRQQDRERRQDQDDGQSHGGGQGGDAGPAPDGQPAEELARALHHRDGARIHQLLAGSDDYPGLARQAAGRTTRYGTKRVLASIALYAVPAAGPAKAAAWIASIVPGPAGKVDKTEVRAVRAILEPAWEALGYPRPAAEDPGATTPTRQDTEEAA